MPSLCEELLYHIAEFGGIDLRLRMGLRPRKVQATLCYRALPVYQDEEACWISICVSAPQDDEEEARRLVVMYSKRANVRQTWVPHSFDLWRIFYIDPPYEAGYTGSKPLIPYAYISQLKRVMRRRDGQRSQGPPEAPPYP